VDSGGPKQARIGWGAYRRYLANTIEPCMCGCYAAMRQQITLTTFLFLSRFSFLRYRILIFLFERFYMSTISAVLISRVGA